MQAKNGHSHSHEGSDFTSDKISKLIRDVTERGKDFLNKNYSKAKGVLDEKAGPIVDKVADMKVKEVADEVKTYIRHNPWKSVGIAVGLGFIIGSVLKSGRNNR